jgi:hypothetical protein
MRDPINFECLIHTLAAIIDTNAPPGAEALALARAAVSLVRDRKPMQAISLAHELNQLHPKYPR